MEIRQILITALDDYLSALQSLDETRIRETKPASSMAELDGDQRPPVSDRSYSSGLGGGLDDGEHRIAITAEPASEPSYLRVSIRVAGDDDVERTVFEWEPRGDDPLAVDTRFRV